MLVLGLELGLVLVLGLALDGLLTPKLNIPIKLHGEQAIILCLSLAKGKV